MASEDEIRLELENANLRQLLEQAGIDAAQQEVAERLQRVILEELHHRVKNTLEDLLRAAIEPFGAEQFIVQTADIEIRPSAALP